MGQKVSYLFVAQDKFTRIARAVAGATEAVRNKMRGLKTDVAGATQRFNAFHKKIKDIKKSVMDVGKGLTKYATAPITALGGAALYNAAKFESLDVAFGTLIGNADEAKKTVEGLMQFTATTPFQMEEVANAGKQLLAFGVPAKDVTNVLRQLGDLAAGTGKPLSEFSLIYGKVLAKGKVQGEELLQLAEKGVSLQTILAKKYGITGEQVAKAVSDGKVSFDVFKSALLDLTGKGGKFNGMTKKLSETLGGLGSTLKDSVVFALVELGKQLVKQFKLKEVVAGLIVKINQLTGYLKDFAAQHPGITKMILIFVGLLAALGPILVIGSQIISGFMLMAVAASIFGIALAPIIISIGAIIALVAGGIAVWVAFREEITLFGDQVGKVIYDAVQDITNFFETLGAKAADVVDSGLGQIAEFFGFGGELNMNKSSRTDINVNLRAQAGTVESVKTKSTGNTAGLKTGVNMVTQ